MSVALRVCRRKDPILSYVPKNDEKNLVRKGLNVNSILNKYIHTYIIMLHACITIGYDSIRRAK